MATEANIENMGMLHSLCEREVQQLSENLNNYLDESATMRRHINSYFVDKSKNNGVNHYVLRVYDNYMSNTQIIIDMARKFNIHLQLRNTSLLMDCWQSTRSVLTDYIEWNMYRDQRLRASDINSKSPSEFDEKKERHLLMEQNIKPLMDYDIYKIADQWKKSCNLSSPMRISEIKPNVPQVIQRDLSDFVEGYEFMATITYIEDYENLVFYICQLRNVAISEISDMYHLPQLVTPPNNSIEIFGVSTRNDGILRAITYLDPDTNSKEKKLLLIDFGEIVDLNETCTLYQLPLKYQNIPTQAIKCVLRGVNYMQNDRAYLSAILRRNEFNRCLFSVVDNVNKTLNLLILSKDNNEEHGNVYNNYKSADKTYVGVTNPFLTTLEEEESHNPPLRLEFEKNCTIKEEKNDFFRDFPFREPYPSLSTSRLIKLEPDEVTRIQRIDPVVNTCIMINVTHIASADCFYAHIIRDQDNNTAMKPNIWTDDQISSLQRLTCAPKLEELILVKYSKDDCWYRAIVCNKINDITFKIFYVDYGNSEIVNLSRMAHCFPDNIGGPFRAIRCQLMGICSNCDNDKILLQEAINFISLILLNETIMVHVVQRLGDMLYIRIIDEDYTELTNSLLKMGYAKELCEGEYIM